KRTDGQTVSTALPADIFQIRITGGMTLSALKVGEVTIKGEIVISFSNNRIDVDLTGVVNLPSLGDALGVGGRLHIDNTGPTIKVWGALAITPNFPQLEKAGLY